MLKVTGLKKSFGLLTVVDDLSVTVEPGCVLGVMGPNGAGKTTFFDLLMNTTVADAGEVLVDGANVTSADTADRVKMGLVRAFQVPRNFESLTVDETLLLAQHAACGKSGNSAREKVDHILNVTGLKQRQYELGGGLRLLDKKRLELAKTLACDPKVVLLDEISGGLTDHEVETMKELITTLKHQGLAVLWIEHIAHALESTCDRILMIHLGKALIEDVPSVVVADKKVRSLYLGSAVQ